MDVPRSAVSCFPPAPFLCLDVMVLLIYKLLTACGGYMRGGYWDMQRQKRWCPSLWQWRATRRRLARPKLWYRLVLLPLCPFLQYIAGRVSTFRITFGEESLHIIHYLELTRCLSSNSFLQQRGVHLPKATSTGTTIVGCLFKDGIVLGADTRATEGEIVADKNCEKVCFYCWSIFCEITSMMSIDSLHYGQHSLLWCWDGSRYRIHHCSYC